MTHSVNQPSFKPGDHVSFPWGRYRGTPWSKVPGDYLQKMLGSGYGTYNQQEDMRKELKRRGDSFRIPLNRNCDRSHGHS